MPIIFYRLNHLNPLFSIVIFGEWLKISAGLYYCWLFFTDKVLYLHGNGIERLSEVEKLGKLVHLKNLTVHGNPMEEVDGYRHFILSRIPQLENLDFSGVTKSDRACAQRVRGKGMKK